MLTKKDITLSYLEKVKQNILRQDDKKQNIRMATSYCNNSSFPFQEKCIDLKYSRNSCNKATGNKRNAYSLSMMLSLAVDAVSKEI